VRAVFDALPAASDAGFRRIVSGGRLHYGDGDGELDLVDELGARLICSALRRAVSRPTLIVLPDELERRPALLFCAALVMDALAEVTAKRVGRRILYVSSYAGVRRQLASVRVGRLTLSDVFAQQYGRGSGEELFPLSVPGGINLPDVVYVSAPADPVALLRTHKPKWVAVDCGESHQIGWLPVLLVEALRLGIPVVGWTTKPFTETAGQWLTADGGVFRWPRLRRGAVTDVVSLDQLADNALQAVLTPRVLAGEHVLELSRAFAEATEGLLAARSIERGRLATDAIAVGWKFLRAMESMPVPLDVYEREASSYWGMQPLADLRRAFVRFVEATRSSAPEFQRGLQSALNALTGAYQMLESGYSPFWLGLSNLCVETSDSRAIVFSSRARRQMFSFCLLAKFNVSEDDLRGVGVRLAHFGEQASASPEVVAEQSRSKKWVTESAPLLVGLPGRFAERYLESYFQAGSLEMLVWPHQEALLDRRLRHLSMELNFASRNLSDLLPNLENSLSADGRTTATWRPLTLGAARDVAAGALGDELGRKAEIASLWTRPDASEAIASLFASASEADDEDSLAPPTLPMAADADFALPGTGDDPWVQEAILIQFEGGQHVLLPVEESVNLVVRNSRQTVVEERYVRSLRAGDEILFIQGQRRQSLYELLVSRVHGDPVIAQYLALVRRWQDDFARAFSEAERQDRISCESLLGQLRAKGSGLTSPQTIRTWVRRTVLAPNDVEDLKRAAEILSLGFVRSYYTQIHNAGRRLKGLHINLSARLNRWLASGEAGTVAMRESAEVIDAELGLTIEDFRDSLLRLRVRGVTKQLGPFYRPNMGRIERGAS